MPSWACAMVAAAGALRGGRGPASAVSTRLRPLALTTHWPPARVIMRRQNAGSRTRSEPPAPASRRTVTTLGAESLPGGMGRDTQGT